MMYFSFYWKAGGVMLIAKCYLLNAYCILVNVWPSIHFKTYHYVFFI